MATSLGEGKLNSNQLNWPCVTSYLGGEIGKCVCVYIYIYTHTHTHTHIQ